MRLGRKETLTEFTERAINATLKGTLIPPMVYIPANLRKRAARLDFDDTATLNPPTDAENLQRARAADPVGFLIAVMQGQPIPHVVVFKEGDALRARTDMETPAMSDRMRAAEALVRFKGKLKPGDAGYEAMIARAAEQGTNS